MKYCNSCGLKLDEAFPKCPHCGSEVFKHICPNCKSEYVGSFCPGCGTKFDAIAKHCPKCGNAYYSRSCPECGYSAVREKKAEDAYYKSIYGKGFGKYSGTSLVFGLFGMMGLLPCTIVAFIFAGKAKKDGEPKSKTDVAYTVAVMGLVFDLIWVFMIIAVALGKLK